MAKTNKKIRALVTGGAGFVGSHLCEELLARGFYVDVIDNLSTSRRSNIAFLLKNKNLKLYKSSIFNQKLMERLVKKCDIVYHLAAAVGVQYILDHPVGSIVTNIEGTQVVLKLADKYHKKILLTSTSEVYGKHACSPFSEDEGSILGSTSVGRWSYAAAKALDEWLALAYAKEKKLPVVIVRLFNTVGPRQVARYGMVLPRFIQNALANKPIIVYGDGLQIRSFLYVKDAVRAMADLSLEKKAEGGIYNIGNDQPISIKELAQKVKCAVQSKSKIKHISFKKAFGGNYSDFEEIECRIPDIAKLKKLLAYQPRYNMDSIIEDTIQYFRGKRGKI